MCSLWSHSIAPYDHTLLFLVVSFLVVKVSYSLWLHSIFPYDPASCGLVSYGRTLLLLVVLVFMVAFGYSLWSCSLWSCSIVRCGHVLLLLVVKFYYSLWLHFTSPCGCTLLLVVTLCYSLCRALLLFVDMLYSSLFISIPCGRAQLFLVVAFRVPLLWQDHGLWWRNHFPNKSSTNNGVLCFCFLFAFNINITC